ncbi:MAG: hypothetical protein HY907_05170 [Deltaproteobacteria bacterium]|nr:hypothetical protein [Deltaproteobacteria bacterium]
MTSLPPWANGPFELLLHAEGHLRGGDDFDRRIALISFDNAVEVAITTYLTLNPIQRGGRSYPRVDVDKWLDNYHTKLDFLEAEIAARGVSWFVERSHIVWVHDHRNAQYHGDSKGTPEKAVLKIIRDAAIWIFSLLFDASDAEAALDNAILDRAAPAAPAPEKAFDVAIDAQYGVIGVGDQSYYASELLFAVDHAAYRDLGERLCAPGDDSTPGTEGEAPR